MNKECFKWCIVKYLLTVEHHPARIRKIDGILADELDFENIKFSVKIKDIHKIKKNNCVNISVFGYENRKKQTHVSKKCYEDKLVDLSKYCVLSVL